MTNVSFVEPNMLWLLLAPPLLFALFAAFADRRSVSKKSHSSIALLMLGITFAGFAAAQPQLMAGQQQRADVIVAIDVSPSMRANDVAPDRFTAARETAKQLIARLPAETRVGIVAFGAEAVVVAPLTPARNGLAYIIDNNLQLRRGTNPAAALSLALDMLALAESPVPRGSAAVVLMGDGVATVEPPPLAVAKTAAERSIRIYTVGLGTPEGEITGWGGRSMNVRLDETSLREVAETTGAKYFAVSSEADAAVAAGQLRLALMADRVTALWFLFAVLAALSFAGAAGAEGYRRGAAAGATAPAAIPASS
ncbi:MAG: VWA domain-containing protein [Rhodospirillaceae bacterium]